MLVYLKKEKQKYMTSKHYSLILALRAEKRGGVNGKKGKKNKTNTFFKADNHRFRNKLRIATAEERRADR